MSLNLVDYDLSDDEEKSYDDLKTSRSNSENDSNKSVNVKENLINLPKPFSVFSKSLNNIVIDKKSKKIKISFASLDEINYDSSDDEVETKPKMRKLNPSSTSSLISLLPSPKNVKISLSSQLIPNSVARAKPNLPAPKKLMPSKEVTENKNNFSSSESSSTSLPYLAKFQDDKAELSETSTYLTESTTDSYLNYYNQKVNLDNPQQSIPSYSSFENTPDINDDITYKKFLASKFGEETPEEINIIDVNVSQHLKHNTEHLKTLSQEKPEEYKGVIPSSTAKRKHQITYLAYQAKQKELQLKNDWAANRLTKSQTRAKYGF